MSERMQGVGIGEPGREEPGYAVDPAGRELHLSPPPAPVDRPSKQEVRAKRRVRRSWRRVGLLVGLVLVGTQVASFGPWFGTAETQWLDLPADLSTLRIESASGDIRVRPVAAGEKAGVSASVRSWGSGDLILRGDRLDARGLCDSTFLGQCDANLEVIVPASASITIDGSSGDVTVSDLSGDVDAKVSSGDIDLLRLTGASVVARATSGEVSVTDARVKRVDASTSSGDVNVSLDSDAESVKAVATSGDVRVQVPSGSAWSTSTEATSGDVTNDIGDDRTAPRTIEARATSGDVDLVRR